MVVFTSFSIITEQFYKITMKSFFKSISGIVLIGTALTMSMIIISKLFIEFRKERAS